MLPPAPLTAQWFKTGNSWALRFPRAFRLPGDAVTLRRDPAAPRIIIEAKGAWDDFFSPDAPRITADIFSGLRDPSPPQVREGL